MQYIENTKHPDLLLFFTLFLFNDCRTRPEGDIFLVKMIPLVGRLFVIIFPDLAMHCSDLIMKSSHQSCWRDHTEDSLISSAPNFLPSKVRKTKTELAFSLSLKSGGVLLCYVFIITVTINKLRPWQFSLILCVRSFYKSRFWCIAHIYYVKASILN